MNPGIYSLYYEYQGGKEVRKIFQFGLSVLNVGAIDEYSLPTTFKVGASATDKGLTVCSDYSQETIGKKSEVNFGVEYVISEVIAPRIGYKLNMAKSRSGISAGIGLKLKNISLDYAFVPYQNLGNSHNIEFLVAFGPTKKILPAPAPVETIPQVTPQLQPPVPAVPKPVERPLLARTTIAVMDLSAAEGISASDVVTISELLRTAIINTNTFIIIERGKLEQVQVELGFQQTGCTEQDCAVKIGKMLNARKVVVGSVGKLGTVYIVNIRIVDVETSKVEYADTGRAPALEEIETTVRELAQRLSTLAR
ncbi:MAG: CsgG/HfaB family protein [Elusimicrobiota bacterium]